MKTQKDTPLSVFKHLNSDLPSGLVVFLVALPLCLGIALASGAPLFSGIITGVVGGILVASLSGSSLSVSGPAAGLTVIVLGGIQALGFQVFLSALVIAGILQIILGYAKAGTIGHYFPSSVIKGMLAAIGIILILKQIPHAVGYDNDYEGDFSFFQNDNENSFSELIKMLSYLNEGAIIVSVFSLAVLLLWEKFVGRKIIFLPAPLMAVLTGLASNFALLSFKPEWALAGEHLVQIPVVGNMAEFKGLFIFPDFSHLNDLKVWTVAGTLAIIASLETLLSIEAVDKLDPQKRNTPTNRELKAQGVGNITAALLGGLPMTAVIVRGAANVNSGAKTKMSAILHGTFMLICVMGIPSLLNKIPLACLAVILLSIGYKLTKIELYRNMYKVGWDQFIPFVVTVLAIVFTDLLIGICIGLAVGVFYILRQNMRNNYSYNKKTHLEGEPIHIVLSQEVSFLNKASLLHTLSKLPENSKVLIDGSKSSYIDYDVLEIIHDFKETANNKKIDLELIGIKEVYKVGGH